MPTIHYLPDAGELKAKYIASHESFEQWHAATQAMIARRISPAAIFMLNPPAGGRVYTSSVIETLDPEAQLPEAWRYVKSRKAIEPRVGAPGRQALFFLDGITIPEDQPGQVLADTGLPYTYSINGFEVESEWMICDGRLWFITPNRADPPELPDTWRQMPLPEFSKLQESWAKRGMEPFRGITEPTD